MAIFILFYGTLYIVLSIIIISGFFLLMRNICYAYSDACVFFAKSFSMRSIILSENNYVVIGPGNPAGELFGMKRIFEYNIFLNIIKLFPHENRLRYVQSFNLILYILYMLVIFFLLFNTLASHKLGYNLALFNSLLFTLLIGARTKIMSVAIVPKSDIINYLFFMISGCLVWFFTCSHSIILAFALGSVVGLAYRNRFSELILIATGLIYLFYIDADWLIKIVYCSGVLFFNIDILYYKVTGKDNPFIYFKHMWRKNVPMQGSEGAVSFVVSVISSIVFGIKMMFNFYSVGSFWPSMGSSLLVFPISVICVYNEGLLNNIFVFMLIYFVVYCFVTIFIRRNQLDADMDTGFFGSRQVYILFPVLLIFNAVAFSFVCINKQYFLMAIYILWIMFYIVHQGYRVLSYYFLDELREKENIGHRKVNFPYMIEIADFIRKVRKPVVLMGYALERDEAHNFFNWSKDVRSVNVRLRIDDRQALDIIEKFKVTHIIISPISYFVGEKCSLGKKALDPLLKDKLRRIDLSPQIIIYEVLSI